MKLRRLVPLLAVVWLIFPASVVSPRIVNGFTLPPGTSLIAVDGGSFQVTTDALIVLEIGFVGDSLVEGSIVVDNLPTAQVTIVWQETSLAVFAGAVHRTEAFRYCIPPEYQAAVDIGHTEK